MPGALRDARRARLLPGRAAAQPPEDDRLALLAPEPRDPRRRVPLGLARAPARGRDRHRARHPPARRHATASSWCSATASWTRARSGRRRSSRPPSGSTTWSRSSTATGSRPTAATEELVPLEPLAAKFEAFGWSLPHRRTGTPSPRSRRPSRTLPAGPGRPTAVIARTVRGKGVPSLEGRADRWFASFTEPRGRGLLAELHGGRRRRARLGSAGGAVSAARDATSRRSLALAASATDLVVMTAENRAPIRGLPAALGPRFIDVGICEQTMIGAAAGLALRGRVAGRPRAGHLPDPARLRVHPHRRRHRPPAGEAGRLRARVPLRGQRADPPGDRRHRGDARRSRACRSSAPPTCGELVEALPQIVASPRPAYVRYTAAPPAVEHVAPFAIGKAEVLAHEEGVAILTYGPLLREAERARRLLAARGVPVRARQPAHARAGRRGGDPGGGAARRAAWSPSRTTSTAAASTRSWPRPAWTHRLAPRVLGHRPRLVLLHARAPRRRARARGASPAPRIAERILDALCHREAECLTCRHSHDELPRTFRSEALYARALGLIPAATQTLAKGPGQYVRGVAPKYLARGRGARVWDVDGNEYLDFSMARRSALARLLLPGGRRGDPRRSSSDGITFSLMHPLEVEVAELVREVVPGAESVRYSKTGGDVTTRRGAPRARLHRPRQGALLRLPRLARLVHRRHRPLGRASRPPRAS